MRNIIAFFVTYAFPFTDFGMPFEVPGAKKSSSFTPNEEALAMVMSMGFNTEQATKALKATVSKVVMSMIKYLVLFKWTLWFQSLILTQLFAYVLLTVFVVLINNVSLFFGIKQVMGFI